MRHSIILLVLTFSTFSFGLATLNVEPIIAYERVQKLIPTRHTKENILYGARLIGGFQLLSLEAEYTRGTDNETFDDIGLTTKDITEKMKLGLRSTFRLVKMIYGFGRAGVQVKKNHHEETQNNITTAWDDPIYIHPYLGAGLRAKMGRNLRFEADFTVIFSDTHDYRYYEYQTTAGFAVEFP